jgi:transcriptional regulator with XRE-family HTH domain
MYYSIMTNGNLADFVAEVMRVKNLSSYDVARLSAGGVSQSTVNKIINRDIRSHSLETLAGLAKGLGVSEDQLFRVARGLPADMPTERHEILAEAFDAKDLPDDVWNEIEGVVEFLVKQRKAIREAVEARDRPPLKSNFKRKKV